MRFSLRAVALVFGMACLVAVGAAFAGFADWGLEQQSQLQNKSRPLFGVGRPLTASSNVDLDAAEALADPAGLITVADGLHVSVVTAGKAAPNLDQMVLWPQANPQYIIGCNEEGVNQPALQKISLSTGDATTIASGINSCDPVRVTPWGTVLFGEENGSVGAMYELIDPLTVVEATIDNVTGVPSTPKIRRVDALGFLSYEGLAILPNGVTYYGDELSASNGAPGGGFTSSCRPRRGPAGPRSRASTSRRTRPARSTGSGSGRGATSVKASPTVSARGGSSPRRLRSSCARWPRRRG